MELRKTPNIILQVHLNLPVTFSGLKSHPGHEIAKKQMKMFGGMIAFEVKGGLEPARNLIEVKQNVLNLGRRFT